MSETGNTGYYRAIYQVEYLSDYPPPHTEDLSRIDYDITEGGASGKVTVVSVEHVTREKMAELLVNQGSDPEFLLGEDDPSSADKQ